MYLQGPHYSGLTSITKRIANAGSKEELPKHSAKTQIRICRFSVDIMLIASSKVAADQDSIFLELPQHELCERLYRLISTSYSNLESSSVSSQDYKSFINQFTKRHGNQALADFLIGLASRLFKESPVIFDGVRDYEVLQRFKNLGSYVVALNTIPNLLARRAVENGHFSSVDEAISAYEREEERYGYRRVLTEGLANKVYDTSNLIDSLIDQIARETLALII